MGEALRFDGQVAIVTGAGQGLGRAYAVCLARRGASVVVNDLSVTTLGERLVGEDRAARVVDEITAAGGDAVVNRDSVASPEAGERITKAALDAFGRLDILVNNAGHKVAGGFGDLSDAQIDHALDVHLRGAFSVTRPAWRVMREQGYGRIVLTSSLGILGAVGTTPYSAAKAGMIGLARVLAVENAGQDVKVNVVVPSAATPGNLPGGDEDWRRWFNHFHPEDVAPVVAFLCHASCPWNAEVLNAGMGRVSRMFLADTVGYYDEHLTPESIAQNVAAIEREDGYLVPRSTMEAISRWTAHRPYGTDAGPRLRLA